MKELNMKQALSEMGIYFPCRFSNRDKQNFLHHLIQQLDKAGVCHELISDKGTHCMIGDWRNASKVIIAHYDTPTLMLLRNVQTSVLDAKSIMINERKNSMLYALLSILLMLPILMIVFVFDKCSIISKLLLLIVSAILALLAKKAASGFPKRMNINDNSASLAILYKLLMTQQLKDTAVLLCDRASMFSSGYLQLSKLEGMNQKSVIVLNSLAAGKHVYCCFQEEEQKTAEELKKQMPSLILKEYSDKQMAKSIIGMFGHSLILFSGEERVGTVFIEKRRTRKDYPVSIERLVEIEKALKAVCFS